MTDKQLFFKYNFIDTQQLEKNILLTNLLKHNNFKVDNYKKDDTFVLLLNTTYNCNANCNYCYNAILRENYGHKIMELDILDQLIDKLGTHINTILFHGGESLLLPDEYFLHVYNKVQEQKLNIRIGVQSNGILLSKEKQDFLSQLSIEPGLSFDGIFNDNTRGQASTQAILKLANEGYFLNHGIIDVISTKNVEHLIDNYLYFKQHNFSRIQTNIVHERILKNNIQLLNNKILQENYEKYLTYWIYDIDKPIQDLFLVRQIERIFGVVSVCTDDDCLGTHFHVDPEGNIGPCGYYLKNYNFGNIKDMQNYNDLIKNTNYIQYIYKIEQLRKSKCINCLYYSVCHGGCLELNYEIDNTLHTINSRYCSLTQLLLNSTYNIIKDLDLTNKQKYNPIFLEILEKNNYYSLSEIKQIEKKGNS